VCKNTSHVFDAATAPLRAAASKWLVDKHHGKAQAMQLNRAKAKLPLLLLLLSGGALLQNAFAASCKTESQMTATERDVLSNTARAMIGNVQTGNVQQLRIETIPAVAANFDGIAASANGLKPLVQHATITVDDLYALDASSDPAGSPETDFYCGTPVVTLNFNSLPPGKYALAIVHATGVQQPQQISLILSEASENHWLLAGFLSRPMVEAGHDGIWYWLRAREYAQKQMDWDAWLYYQTAGYLLNPATFLTSPHFEKLQQEMNKAKPASFPETAPTMLDVHGSNFELMTVGTTTAFGTLDLEVHYTPSTEQLAQLHDPAAARKQVVDVMQALLAAHPELRAAFHGIWMRADEGNVSVFALDLPMNEIAGQTTPAA
jgi:hypothetical protein